MKQGWHPDELVQHWTLCREERALLGNKAGATRLGFAVLLKAFQFEGRFPERREDVVTQIVFHLANQTGVPLETYFEEEWSERTQRHQRAQIREYCGFQLFHAEDEPTFIAWLKERVASFNSEAEAFKIAAYSHLRTLCLEPPPPERMRRLLRLAVAQREEQMVAEATAQLMPTTRQALDALVNTQIPGSAADVDQMPLFPMRSELAAVKDDAGAATRLKCDSQKYDPRPGSRAW